MKRILLTLFVGLLSLTVSAQYVASYNNSLEGKEHSIVTDEQGKYLHISVPGRYTTDIVSFMIATKDIPAFYEGMSSIYNKYLEWDKVAKDNNVTDMRKEFDIPLPKITLAWKSSDYFFEYKHTLKPAFVVLEDGVSYCVMSGKGVCSTNRYIDQEYYFVVGGDDFKEFVEAIKPETIAAGKAENKKIDDLFK